MGLGLKTPGSRVSESGSMERASPAKLSVAWNLIDARHAPPSPFVFQGL
jgi:hypothetical protein